MGREALLVLESVPFVESGLGGDLGVITWKWAKLGLLLVVGDGWMGRSCLVGWGSRSCLVVLLKRYFPHPSGVSRV